MNIFFADLRGLTLELQTPTDLDPGAASPSPGRSGEDLDPDAARRLQAIEFNKFFDRLSAPETVVDETVRALPDGAWREFLAHAPLQVTTDGEPALLRPAESVTPLRVMPATTVAPAVAPGESLPAGGNSLPGPAPALPPGIVVAQPANLPARPPAPVIAHREARAAAVPPRAAAEAPITPRGDRLLQARAGDLPPAPSGGRRFAAAVTPRTAQSIAAGRSQLPAATAASTHAPQPASVSVPPSAEGTPAGGIAFASVPTGSASRPAMAALADGVDATRLTAQQDRFAAPRAPAAALESALANASRPAAVAVPGMPEIAIGDGLPRRAADAPLPASANSGTAPAIAAAPAPAIPAAPAANAAVLPPQLESLSLPRQAGAADWASGLGERVSWMIDQRHNSATIRLDPPTLGKLDVQVRVADDATTITIQAQHAPTRELIEASATRLRDFLQESGFQNVNVDVSQRHDQQQARAQAAPDAHERADGAPPEPEDQPGSIPADRLTAGDGAGLIDTFA